MSDKTKEQHAMRAIQSTKKAYEKEYDFFWQ